MPVQIGQTPDHDFSEPLGLLSDCHRRIERFLNVLAAAAAEGRAPEMNDEVRRALAGALLYFREAAPKHTADEEISLFPRLRATGSTEVQEALAEVERLEADHARADRLHREVDQLGLAWLANGAMPEQDAERLVQLIDELKSIYSAHIATEDSRVFPLAKRVLDSQAQHDIGREMAARRGRRAEL